jgi:hypothetical protein
MHQGQLKANVFEGLGVSRRLLQAKEFHAKPKGLTGGGTVQNVNQDEKLFR